MLRKFIIGIIIAGCTGALLVSYFFLKEEVKQHEDPIIAIPKSAAIIAECQNIRETWSRISETNLVWSEVLAIPEIQKLDRKVRVVDSLFSTSQGLEEVLDNKKTVVSFHSTARRYFSAFSVPDIYRGFSQWTHCSTPFRLPKLSASQAFAYMSSIIRS